MQRKERTKLWRQYYRVIWRFKKNKYDFTEPVEGHRNADLTRDNIEDIKHKVILDKTVYYIIYIKKKC